MAQEERSTTAAKGRHEIYGSRLPLRMTSCDIDIHDDTGPRRRSIPDGHVPGFHIVFAALGIAMPVLIAGGLLLGIIIVALYFFGAFKSPYIGLPYFWLFRFALLLLLMLTFWYGERERLPLTRLLPHSAYPELCGTGHRRRPPSSAPPPRRLASSRRHCRLRH